MRKMKDSGIAWIGEIPEDWKGIRLKELFNKKQGGAWGDEAKENENDRVCIRVADFDFERQTAKEGQKTVRNYNADVISKLQIQGNELLIEKSGGGEKTPVGRSILTDGLEGDLYANFIDKLPIKAANYPKYVAYYMKTLYQNNIVIPYIKQTTGIQNLDLESLLFEIIIVPQYIEQQKIADFLDKKCSEIDKLIELQESMIEKLKEYKQSVITQAVTKGLDPDVPMKDSGIEWIGKISQRFVLRRIKEIVRILDEYRKPITSDLRNQNAEILYDYYGASGVIDKIDGYTIDDHVMLIGEDGANLRMRNLPLMYEVKGKAWINNHAHILKPKKDTDFYFLFYCLESMDINPYITGSAQPKLSQENLKNILLPIPPFKEQQQIADYLDKKCAEIDDLIKLKEQKIEKLKEYKKSLIYEYVTGKKEVV